MAISGVSYNSAYPATSIASISVTAGNLIVVGCNYYNDATHSTTCIDNASGGANTYTEVTFAPGGSGDAPNTFGHVFWAIAKATETLTITVSTQTDQGLSIHVYSGSFDSGLVEDYSTYASSTTSTSHTSDSVTVAGAAMLFAFWFAESTNYAQAPSDSFTERTEQSGHSHATNDYGVTAGTYTSAITTGTASRRACILVAFKEAAATGSPWYTLFQ